MSVLSVVLLLLAVLAAVGAAVLWRLGTPEKTRGKDQPAPAAGSQSKKAEHSQFEETQPGSDASVEKAEESAKPAKSIKASLSGASLPVSALPVASLPGAARRERRAWAQAHDFEHRRHDDYLVDEWSRGAAATGAQARDFVIGVAYGHEVFLMDLGGVPVMAMRTGQASDVVADFRRTEPQEVSEDLIRIFEVEGFIVYATDQGAVERLIDVRTTTSLSMLPQVVTAVWMESDWVLAECEKNATVADFDDLLAPLAMLADVARVLPPRTEFNLGMALEDHTPSRPMPEPPTPDLVGSLVSSPEEKETLIFRPDEPIDMPSRTQHEVFGEPAENKLGEDEQIATIGDGSYKPEYDSNYPRVTRDLDGNSDIFTDHDTP